MKRERERCPGNCGKFAGTYSGAALFCDPCFDRMIDKSERDFEDRLYREGRYSMYAGVR
jgi:hypothetical protein